MTITGRVFTTHAHWFRESGNAVKMEPISLALLKRPIEPNYYSIQVLNWKNKLIHCECWMPKLQAEVFALNVGDLVQLNIELSSTQVGDKFYSHISVTDILLLNTDKKKSVNTQLIDSK